MLSNTEANFVVSHYDERNEGQAGFPPVDRAAEFGWHSLDRKKQKKSSENSSFGLCDVINNIYLLIRLAQI